MELSKMRKSVLGFALLALGMLSVARNASADDGVNPAPFLGVVGLGALDVGLVAADLAAGARGEWRSRAYGGVEAAVGGAQLAICLDQTLSTQRSGGTPGAWEVGAGFGAILMAHGLATLLAPRSHTEAPSPPGPVMIAPLALGDVARATVPGLAVLGLF
jgi:hypothetical protein